MLLKSASPHQEPMRLRIAPVQDPLREAADESVSRDFRDNPIEVGQTNVRQHAPLEHRPDDRLVDECRAKGELPSRVQLRDTPRGAGPGWRAVDLAIGEHTTVSLRRAGVTRDT